MEKRRIVEQLPVVNQTDINRRFFAATVDHLFQPGRTETLSGYIGRKPSYYDESKDFYVAEPSASRQAYQLEPAMVSLDANGVVTNLLFFDDFVDHLAERGAQTDDHNRLFQSEVYAWAPPIDIDKVTNFSQYFWFGDRINLPTVVLTAPRASYTGDGATASFALPAPLDRFSSADETPALFVDQVRVTAFARVGDAIVLDEPPPVGAEVETIRYGDLKRLILDRPQFSTDGLTDQPVTDLTSTMQLRIEDATTLYRAYDMYRFDTIGWDLDVADTFSVECVGTGIVLVPVDLNVAHDPRYVVCARGALDASPWADRNAWVHRSAFAWSGVTMADRAARRPIIEYALGLRLHNYGTNRLTDVDATASGTLRIVGDDGSTEPLPLAQINGQRAGRILVDNDHALIGGERLLVRQSADSILNNRIYRVSLADVPGDQVIILTLEEENQATVARTGDIVRNVVTGVEYHFDGSAWVESQPVSETPLFSLFDADGVALDDAGRYPGSDFAGSTVFRYAPGDTTDRVLGFGVQRDERGDIVFDMAVVTERVNADTGPIPGTYLVEINPRSGNRRYVSHWHATGRVSAQTQDTDGVWTVPPSIQANPLHQEITTASYNQLFGHLVSILGNQHGFSGNAVTINNWRDGPKDLSQGRMVVQHRAPMLRAMLLSSDERFDVLSAVRYVEREYTRYRAKFINKISEYLRNGILSVDDGADLWVDAIMADLAANKGPQFAFAHSPVGGTGRFVPATPAAVGLVPAVPPAFETDDTYAETVTFLRGHDGSRVPVFGDFRDAILLAFEQRVYASIPETLRERSRPFHDVAAFADGKFRTGVYSRDEWITMLTPMFERWVQASGFDYRAHGGVDMTDPFSWNYAGTTDRDGDPLPGSWRAIYRHWFDTDRPHLAPWEMLGFSHQPDWWEDRYGEAPYTRGNAILWEDLEAGYIAAGERQGIHEVYVRPGLSEVIPVDDDGALLDPVAARIVMAAPTYQQASRSWRFGDEGPVETLWINSPSYRFALAQLAYLMAPTRFVEIGWNTASNHLSQGRYWIVADAGLRPQPSDILVHGELDADGNRVAAWGIQAWIVDHLAWRGVPASVLGQAVRGIGARLAHKMGGFTNRADIKVLADNFGLLPLEDVLVEFYRSPSVREEVYSGVIVEWTGTGWRVIGYDATSPMFTVMPGDVSGPKVAVTLSGEPEPVVVVWQPNVFFLAGTIVEYDGSTYRANRSHTSGPSFEVVYWDNETGVGTPSQRVLKYTRWTGETLRIPYGTEFSTFQDLADVLFGHERWLESRGWVFDQLDETSGAMRDWSLMAREFMEWAQIEWQPGTFIALSPLAERAKFTTSFGTVLDAERAGNAAADLVGITGVSLDRRSTLVNRYEDEVEIIATNGDLYGARLRVATIEHALVFSNTTIFNDIVYDPLFDLRQPRLKIIAKRPLGWKGRMDAPGYILDGDALLPNFDRAAEDVAMAFDIERSDRTVLRDHARHNAGFQPRDYMRNLLISDTQQFEFYQGMIQSKGTSGALDKLLRSQFITQYRDLRFLEEWAFRIGDYGDVENRRRFSFELRHGDLRANPQYVQTSVAPDTDSDLWIDLPLDDSRWVARPARRLFDERPGYATDTGDLPTAGYARIDEVDHTAVSSDDLNGLFLSLLDQDRALSPGERVWVYDRDHEWDVLRVIDLHTTVARVSGEDENGPAVGALIECLNNHSLSGVNVGDFLVIVGETRTQDDLMGVHRITRVNGRVVEVESRTADSFDFVEAEETGPALYLMRGTRVPSMPVLTAEHARFPFAANEIAYVDQHDGRWATLRHTGHGWGEHRVQPKRPDAGKIAHALVYSRNTRIDDDRLRPNPLVIDRVMVFDPISGIISGAADREIAFKVDFDPANYTHGADIARPETAWGVDQIGRLWWDLSAVRYLDPMTDEIRGQSARDLAEIDHRVRTFNRLAPGTSIDVYEWTRSDVAPLDWTSEDGSTLYQPAAPRWVEREEKNEDGSFRTVYYFWVKNATTVPVADDRALSALAVARIIQTPETPWMTPITTDGLLVGDIANALDDQGTILQVETKRDQRDGLVHGEWRLLRPGDDRSLPPDALWRKMRDSLAGFDDALRVVPDPYLHEISAVGILDQPRQTMFSGGHDGMMTARRAFVENVNDILSRVPMVIDRPAALTALEAESPISDHLVWAATGRTMEPVPPATQWDIQVFSMAERDHLLLDTDFVENPRRVLVNGLAHDTPQWSVWDVDMVELARYADDRAAHADAIFRLAQSYQHRVATDAERDQITVGIGERVLVETSVGGLWVVWRRDPAAALPGDNGFVPERWQNYRVRDTWETVDWYAAGYETANAPLVSYADAFSRNRSENPNPRNALVRIGDDGSGNWAWTAFENGAWVTVARERGTIRFVNALFAADAPEDSGWDMDEFETDNFDSIKTTYDVLARSGPRDHSHDLRMIVDLLRDDVLTALEVNELFFAMVHFVHAQQDEVPWAFKTSFLSVAGFNEPLKQTPVEQPDNTEHLLSYIEEVKPYRVKIRDFVRSLAPDVDVATVFATDFDKPPYFDPARNVWRQLDPTRPLDAAILARDEPWASWYNDHVVESNARVRKFKIKLRFDRVASTIEEGWDMNAFERFGFDDESVVDETAENLNVAERILAHYHPQPGMPRLDLRTLLGEGKVSFVDGGDLSMRRAWDGMSGPLELPFDEVLDGNATAADVQINPDVGGRPGYALADRKNPDHPEELVPVVAEDAVWMRVVSKSTPGSPPSTVRIFDMETVPQTFVHGAVAQSADAVMVYLDGRRAASAAYTVDVAARSVTVLTAAKTVIVHAFGPGGDDAGIPTLVRTVPLPPSADGTWTLVHASTPDPSMLVVEADGLRVDPSRITATPITLTITPPIPTTARVDVTTFENGGTMAASTHIFTIGDDAPLVIPRPYADDQCWVTLNGRRIVEGVDFWLRDGAAIDEARILVPYATEGDRLVVTVFAARPAEMDAVMMAATAKPSWSRLIPAMMPSDWDVAPYDTVGLDSPAQDRAMTTQGPRLLYLDNRAWDYALIDATGTIEHDVGPDAHSIAIAFDGDRSVITPPNPDRKAPGSVWIDGERIEFFAMESTATGAIISELRRGTRGTRVSGEHRRRVIHTGDGVTVSFSISDVGDGPLDVMLRVGDRKIFPSASEYSYTVDARVGTVVFVDPPETGTVIILAKTNEILHRAGTTVYDGIKVDSTPVSLVRRRRRALSILEAS